MVRAVQHDTVLAVRQYVIISRSSKETGTNKPVWVINLKTIVTSARSSRERAARKRGIIYNSYFIASCIKKFGAGGTWDHDLPHKNIGFQLYGAAVKSLAGRILGFDRMILSGLASKVLFLLLSAVHGLKKFRICFRGLHLVKQKFHGIARV